ncbi:diaminopimelate decarboxylase domain protein [Mycobacterium xenopi 3993]|nr:diaminopimelate decarboxylase domain protein [Mycobacterium xenopi 3993]
MLRAVEPLQHDRPPGSGRGAQRAGRLILRRETIDDLLSLEVR